MECTQCRTDNPTSFRFCGACGYVLAVTPCGACGFSTPLPFRFCGSCGAGLELTGSGKTEERKLASVMFADVVGFTSLAERTDAEVMARAVDVAFRQLGEIVVAHGGTVDKYIGDSVMAVFGVPQAHDDDAERAVAAALAIQAADMGLGFSIGVNTGEVMVMGMGGGAMTVMGDAVNVAARLEKAANRGEVLVGPMTAELTAARVHYQDRPAMRLKGKTGPVDVRLAIELRATPVPAEPFRAPLIGREEELGFLLSQWRRVGTIGRAGVELVTGDPGIGKSRLLDELAVRVGPETHVVRSAYPPYGGFGGLRVGGDLAAQFGPSSDPAVDARLRSLSGDIDPSLRGMDAAALRNEQLWALRRMAEERAARGPVLVLIDDVHMAATSLELLTAFVSRIVDLPVLVVFAGRSDGRWLASFPTASTVRLPPLAVPDVEALAAVWQPGLPASEKLKRLSGGNPLFLRELLALSASSHKGARGPLKQLPASLRAVLAARLDGLSAAERGALQDLAVVGDQCTVEQLVVIGGPMAAEGVTTLTIGGLVRHRPDGTLMITEPLLREVAYEALPRAVRVERHVRVGELCTSPIERARHFARASEHAPDDEALRLRAVDALVEAGINALEAARPAEGVPLLQRAVGLGHRDPQIMLRLAAALIDTDRSEALSVLELVPEDTGDPRIAAERTLVLANALSDLDHQAAMEAFDEAARKFHAIGDPVKEGWAHSNKGVALFMAGQMAAADDELAAGLELFRAAKHRTGEMANVSFRALVRPDHPDVEEWLHDSLAYAVELGDRSRHLSALTSLSWHHFLRSRLGGPAETAVARAWIDETIALASELGTTDALLQALCLQANLARLEGRLAEARELVARAQRIGPVDSRGERALLRVVSASLDTGSPFEPLTDTDPFSSVAAVIQLETALFEGRVPEVLAIDGRPDRSNLGRHEVLVGYVPFAAGMAVVGEIESAETLAMEALVAARRSGTAAGAAAARAILAECAARKGDVESALSLLPGSDDDLPGGLAGALIHRAQVALGDPEAMMALRADADRLMAPGLLVGISEPTASDR